MIIVNPLFVEELILLGKSHREISIILKETFRQRGFSVRSVRRFCDKYNKQ
jgi:3-methyladenine DNA glycosylase AlkC